MLMLVPGLVIWTVVHLFPSLAPARRQQLISRLGNDAYRGIFSLSVIAGLLLIVFGWRSTEPVHLYAPMAELRHPAMLLAVAGLILMVAAGFPTRLKRIIRHPQLTGVLLWAVAHLLLNGDSRSLLVFATLAAWSVASMLAINRRDGAWVKPVIQGGWGREAVMIVSGLIISAVVVAFHEYLSGVGLVS